MKSLINNLTASTGTKNTINWKNAVEEVKTLITDKNITISKLTSIYHDLSTQLKVPFPEKATTENIKSYICDLIEKIDAKNTEDTITENHESGSDEEDEEFDEI